MVSYVSSSPKRVYALLRSYVLHSPVRYKKQIKCLSNASNLCHPLFVQHLNRTTRGVGYNSIQANCINKEHRETHFLDNENFPKCVPGKLADAHKDCLVCKFQVRIARNTNFQGKKIMTFVNFINFWCNIIIIKILLRRVSIYHKKIFNCICNWQLQTGSKIIFSDTSLPLQPGQG